MRANRLADPIGARHRLGRASRLEDQGSQGDGRPDFADQLEDPVAGGAWPRPIGPAVPDDEVIGRRSRQGLRQGVALLGLERRGFTKHRAKPKKRSVGWSADGARPASTEGRKHRRLEFAPAGDGGPWPGTGAWRGSRRRRPRSRGTLALCAAGYGG